MQREEARGSKAEPSSRGGGGCGASRVPAAKTPPLPARCGPMGCSQRCPPVVGYLQSEHATPAESQIPARIHQHWGCEEEKKKYRKKPNTKLPGLGSGKQKDFGSGDRAARRASAASAVASSPEDPTMCPFVVPVGGWLPAERSFQWEYSKVQPLAAAQGWLDCAPGTKGQCFLGSGEVLQRGTRLFSSPHRSCLSGGKEESRQDRSQRLTLKGESRKDLFIWGGGGGGGIKEFGDFFWLKAAAVLPRWLRFPGKQGIFLQN